MDAEDSLEGLVKVATCKKVYKCLEDKIKHITHLIKDLCSHRHSLL